MSGRIGCGTQAKSVEWYTPAWVFEELGVEFDLDPCSPHDMASHVPAQTKYTVFDNGLAQQWHGRVWLNPPYGPDTGIWMRRMIAHGHGLAMVFSRTDAAWFQEAMRSADATLFLLGRVDFLPGTENQHKKGRAGAGTALFAWGDDCVSALNRLAPRGTLFSRPEAPAAGLQPGFSDYTTCRTGAPSVS
jgi:hypothetical protein